MGTELESYMVKGIFAKIVKPQSDVKLYEQKEIVSSITHFQAPLQSTQARPSPLGSGQTAHRDIKCCGAKIGQAKLYL